MHLCSKIFGVHCDNVQMRLLLSILPSNNGNLISFNPLRANFFGENINIYLHFTSFLHTNNTQVIEIPQS